MFPRAFPSAAVLVTGRQPGDPALELPSPPGHPEHSPAQAEPLKARLQQPGLFTFPELNSTQSKQLNLGCERRSLQAITNGESTPCPAPPGAPTTRWSCRSCPCALGGQDPQGNRDLPGPEPPHTSGDRGGNPRGGAGRWGRAGHE